jgi:predicted  nucleic acid-binding Zn-ribbon protein
MDRMK